MLAKTVTLYVYSSKDHVEASFLSFTINKKKLSKKYQNHGGEWKLQKMVES